MTKKHAFLLLTLHAVFLSGCVMLKTYEARPLPPGIQTTLRSYQAGGALGDAIRESRVLAEHYQHKLAPVLIEMHQSAKIVGQDKQSRLLAQARGQTASMTVIAGKVRSSWLRYQTSIAGAGGEKAMAAEIGLRLSERCLSLLDRTRRMLDLTEGYIRAGVEKNLSYLSPGNQRQFNREMTALDAASVALLSEYEALVAALQNLRRH
jgi:hypothetical protein